MYYFSNQAEIFFIFLGTFMDWCQFRLNGINNWPFAIKTAYSSTSAAFLNPGADLIIGVYLMQFPHRTLFRVPRIRTPYPGGIGWHRAEFLRNLVGFFA